MWALSPPGTTDSAALGRRVPGAWSVAWSPPLLRRAALLLKVPVRGAILLTPGGVPPNRSAAGLRRAAVPPVDCCNIAPGTHLGIGVARGLSKGDPLALAPGASMVPKRRRPPRLSGGGPRWSQSEGGPLALAAGASVFPKRQRPPGLSGGGLGGAKAREAPSPQRRGPRWSKKKNKEAPSPQRRGPRCCQSGGGRLASGAVASVFPKRRRPPRLSGKGPPGPEAKETPSPQQWGPRWYESQGGPLAPAAGAKVVPERRRPPRLSGGGLDGSEAKEAPLPQQRARR